VRNATSQKAGLFSVFRRSSKTQDAQNRTLHQFSTDIGELAKPDKRFISGDRVICACSLQFPKIDCFSPIQTSHEGCLVFNLRGGAFYTKDQFCDDTVTKIFNPGELGLIKRITLYPKDQSPISLGDIHARFLKFTGPKSRQGMVLRFAKLSDSQINTFNELTHSLAKCEESEQVTVDKFIRRKNV
jgi:hypothetical protein